MTHRDELRPCPFCGEAPYLHEPDFKGDDWQVGCRCEGGGYDEDEHGAIWRNGKTFEEVAARWNRRAAPQEAPTDFASSLMQGRETFVTRCDVCSNKHSPHCSGCNCARTAGCSDPPGAAPQEAREPEATAWREEHDRLLAVYVTAARSAFGGAEKWAAYMSAERALHAHIDMLAAARPAPETEREPDASELRDNIAGAVQDAIEAVVKKRLRVTPAMNRAAGEIMAFVAAAHPAPDGYVSAATAFDLRMGSTVARTIWKNSAPDHDVALYLGAPAPAEATEASDESARCTCEWMSPEDGSVHARWPAVLDARCAVHSREEAESEAALPAEATERSES